MLSFLSMLAQEGGDPRPGGTVSLVISLAFIVLMIASLWTVFTKAGKPGWASIIPIYNLIVLLEIVGKPLWWILLLLIPLVNLILLLLIYMELARRFGKSELFGIGLWLLGPIFFPILAFGDARYRG